MNSLADAKDHITIFDLWQHFNLPDDPKKNPCRSPFRDDRRPSFSVSPDGKLFHDFANGDGGSNVDFFQRATGLSQRAACKAFVELAGTGRVTISGVRPTSADTTGQHTRRKPSLPPMQHGAPEQLCKLAALRNIHPDALQIASDRGLLWFADWKRHPSWIVTDRQRVNAQARRLDGQLWPAIEAKAQTLPGCWAAWPIGILEAQPFPTIALTEGGPDLLTAFHFAYCEEREADIAPVAILGASNRIHADALPHFAGKRVRIFPHLDSDGRDAAQRWTVQLESVGATVDCFDFANLPMTNGQPVNDLNDLTLLEADAFESDRQLWSVFP